MIVAGVVLLGLLVVVPIIVLLTGANGDEGEVDANTVVVNEREVTIEIRDFEFAPSNISVPRGASVTWLNDGNAPHDATDNDGGWDTETLTANESETLTFDKAGTYDYHCSIHPGMNGKLTIR